MGEPRIQLSEQKKIFAKSARGYGRMRCGLVPDYRDEPCLSWARLVLSPPGLALENPVRGQERISKAEAQYRNAPNGIQRCEICLQFKPPKQCELVDGDIRPKGWCQYFAGKENEQ